MGLRSELRSCRDFVKRRMIWQQEGELPSEWAPLQCLGVHVHVVCLFYCCLDTKCPVTEGGTYMLCGLPDIGVVGRLTKQT